MWKQLSKNETYTFSYNSSILWHSTWWTPMKTRVLWWQFPFVSGRVQFETLGFKLTNIGYQFLVNGVFLFLSIIIAQLEKVDILCIFNFCTNYQCNDPYKNLAVEPKRSSFGYYIRQIYWFFFNLEFLSTHFLTFIFMNDDLNRTLY